MDEEQVADLIIKLGLGTPKEITLVKKNNHVFKVVADLGTYFLKVYTKDWYSKDPRETSGPAKHEYFASQVLRANKIKSIDVVSHGLDSQNSIERPYLLTRELSGKNLLSLLKKSPENDFQKILVNVGDYLRRVNSITFENAGYIDGLKGPSHLPIYNGWQHRMWTANARQKDAFKNLEESKEVISPEIKTKLTEDYLTISKKLAGAYSTPNFIFGDCHGQHFFVENWQVTGVIDMEVASGGDKIEDFLKFSIEMAREFPSKTKWWTYFFEGYEEEPDFELFKLRLQGTSMRELKWGESAEKVYIHILESKDWQELFNLTFHT